MNIYFGDSVQMNGSSRLPLSPGRETKILIINSETIFIPIRLWITMFYTMPKLQKYFPGIDFNVPAELSLAVLSIHRKYPLTLNLDLNYIETSYVIYENC